MILLIVTSGIYLQYLRNIPLFFFPSQKRAVHNYCSISGGWSLTNEIVSSRVEFAKRGDDADVFVQLDWLFARDAGDFFFLFTWY